MGLAALTGTLECRAKADPQPYQDLPGGFPGHLHGALFRRPIIRHSSMTPREASIVGADWAQEWSQWCAATRSPEAPAEGDAAIPLEGWGTHTVLRR